MFQLVLKAYKIYQNIEMTKSTNRKTWDYLKLSEDTKFLFIVFLQMIPG